MKDFAKNYLLGSLLMIVYLPRIVLGALLLFLPVAAIGFLLQFVLHALLASILALLIGLYISMETPYAALIKRVWPFSS